MGTRHLEALAVNPNCEVAAVCDCFTPRYENAVAVVKKFSGKAPDGYQDFRRVLDRPDIDAIFAPTPDHWHPLMAILGCQAGKDVYVEKPARPPWPRAGPWSRRRGGMGGSSSSAPSSGR